MDVDALLAKMDEAIDGKGKAPTSTSATVKYSSSTVSRLSSKPASAFEEEHKAQPAANSRESAMQRVTASRAASSTAGRSGKQSVDDLDNLLSSMDELISAPSAASSTTHQPSAATIINRTPTKPTASPSTTNSQPAATSCTPVILHSASPAAPQPCSRLLCLSCDHRVLSIPQWLFRAEADYVFLRTTVPDVGKLRERMDKCEGGMGWCCQCMYVNVKRGETVRVDGGRGSKCRWICAGHNKWQ